MVAQTQEHVLPMGMRTPYAVLLGAMAMNARIKVFAAVLATFQQILMKLLRMFVLNAEKVVKATVETAQVTWLRQPKRRSVLKMPYTAQAVRV